MALRTKTATALSIADRVLAHATVQAGKQGAAIKSLGLLAPARPLAPLTQPEVRHINITETVREGLNGRKMQRAVLIERQRDAKAHFAWLPSADPAEVAQMAAFELDKAVPVESGRYISGHVVLETDGAQRTNCLMIAVDRAAVDSSVRGLMHAGVEVERTTIAGWAICRAWREARRRGVLEAARADSGEMAAGEAGRPCYELILHLGTDSVDTVLLRDEQPIFMRSSSNGLYKMLVNLARAEAAIDLKDFDRIDIEHLDYSILEVLDGREAAAAAAQPGIAALAMDSVVSFPGGRELPADDEKVPTAAAMDDSLEASGAFMKTTGEVSMWGGGPGEIIRTWLDRVSRELRRTMTAAQAQARFSGLERVTICGPGAGLKNVAGHFQKQIGAPAETLDGLCGLPLDLELAKGETAPAYSAAERGLFLAPIGAALESVGDEGMGKGSDLRPDWYLERLATGDRRRFLATTLINAAVCLALALLYFQLRQTHMQNLIDTIRAENQRMEPLAEHAIDMQEKLDIVRKHVDGSYSALEVLDMIAGIDVVAEPNRDGNARVRLKRANFVRGDEIFIRGEALGIPDFNDFQIGLERSGFFLLVTPKSSQMTPERYGKSVLQFDVVADLRSDIPTRRGSRNTRSSATFSPSSSSGSPGP